MTVACFCGHSFSAPPAACPRCGVPVTGGRLDLRERRQAVFAELGRYGITARDDVDGPATLAHAALSARLRKRHPHGLGSYVFRLREDEPLRLHCSGPEAADALRAACAHHGLKGAIVELPRRVRLAAAA